MTEVIPHFERLPLEVRPFDFGTIVGEVISPIKITSETLQVTNAKRAILKHIAANYLEDRGFNH